MTSAVECDRCKKVSTVTLPYSSYSKESYIAKIIWLHSERRNFDLCPECQENLEYYVKQWWIDELVE